MSEPSLAEYFKYTEGSSSQPDSSFTDEVKYASSRMEQIISFHEAGHYMLGELILRLGLDFTDLERVQIQVTPSVCDGVVEGVLPPTKNPYDLESAKSWFREDSQRSLVSLLSSLAGDITYKVFIQQKDDYILRMVTNSDGDNVVRFFTLKQALWLSVDSFAKETVNDCDNALVYCSYAGLGKFEDQINICYKASQILEELMAENAVQHGIKNMKNYLLKEKNKPIKGKYLSYIRSKVNELTKRVDLSPYLLSLTGEVEALKISKMTFKGN